MRIRLHGDPRGAEPEGLLRGTGLRRIRALGIARAGGAKREIVLVDGYVDTRTLNIFAKKEPGVSVTVWTHPKTSLTERDVATFNAQYPTLMVKHTASFHDRFLILDGAESYLIGASLKDAGKKSFAVAKLENSAIVGSIVAALGK